MCFLCENLFFLRFSELILASHLSVCLVPAQEHVRGRKAETGPSSSSSSSLSLSSSLVLERTAAACAASASAAAAQLPLGASLALAVACETAEWAARAQLQQAQYFSAFSSQQQQQQQCSFFDLPACAALLTASAGSSAGTTNTSSSGGGGSGSTITPRGKWAALTALDGAIALLLAVASSCRTTAAATAAAAGPRGTSSSSGSGSLGSGSLGVHNDLVHTATVDIVARLQRLQQGAATPLADNDDAAPGKKSKQGARRSKTVATTTLPTTSEGDSGATAAAAVAPSTVAALSSACTAAAGLLALSTSPLLRGEWRTLSAANAVETATLMGRFIQRTKASASRSSQTEAEIAGSGPIGKQAQGPAPSPPLLKFVAPGAGALSGIISGGTQQQQPRASSSLFAGIDAEGKAGALTALRGEGRGGSSNRSGSRRTQQQQQPSRSGSARLTHAAAAFVLSALQRVGAAAAECVRTQTSTWDVCAELLTPSSPQLQLGNAAPQLQLGARALSDSPRACTVLIGQLLVLLLSTPEAGAAPASIGRAVSSLLAAAATADQVEAGARGPRSEVEVVRHLRSLTAVAASVGDGQQLPLGDARDGSVPPRAGVQALQLCRAAVAASAAGAASSNVARAQQQQQQQQQQLMLQLLVPSALAIIVKPRVTSGVRAQAIALLCETVAKFNLLQSGGTAMDDEHAKEVSSSSDFVQRHVALFYGGGSSTSTLASGGGLTSTSVVIPSSALSALASALSARALDCAADGDLA